MKAERMRRFPSAALKVTVQALQTNEGRRCVMRAAMWMMWVELANLGSSLLSHACAMAWHFVKYRQLEVVSEESQVRPCWLQLRAERQMLVIRPPYAPGRASAKRSSVSWELMWDY